MKPPHLRQVIVTHVVPCATSQPLAHKNNQSHHCHYRPFFLSMHVPHRQPMLGWGFLLLNLIWMESYRICSFSASFTRTLKDSFMWLHHAVIHLFSFLNYNLASKCFTIYFPFSHWNYKNINLQKTVVFFIFFWCFLVCFCLDCIPCFLILLVCAYFYVFGKQWHLSFLKEWLV